ncbi:NAD(P)H-dependent oxidoreductase [Rhodovulum sulfidophilum]|nr:NAD(P)H-dependent oxidoreductase [Rhodovulum sulfidophilum]
MNILIITVHPDPTSLTHSLSSVATDQLKLDGHKVRVSDLYAMNWKSAVDHDDFPALSASERLKVGPASKQAYSTGSLTEDVVQEQEKLLWADAVIIAFPLWWFSMPAILKGWVERTLSYGFGYGRGEHTDTHWGDRYGEGLMAGKRAMLCIMIGGWEPHYGPRGVNGPVDDILFPMNHGVLYYPGFTVLPSFLVYRSDRLDEAGYNIAVERMRDRMKNLFTAEPIPYRMQNGGDHLIPSMQLRPELNPGITGFAAHLKPTDEENS